MTSLNQSAPSKPAIRSILVALMLAIFLGALDQTIVAVSMPAISAQFSTATAYPTRNSRHDETATFARPARRR